MNKNDTSLLERLIVFMFATPLILIGMIALWFISSLMKGFVLTKMWVWFVIPLFPTLPMLTLWQAVGLAMIPAFITASTTVHKDHETALGASFFATLINPWLVLLCAWIAHLIIGA